MRMLPFILLAACAPELQAPDELVHEVVNEVVAPPPAEGSPEARAIAGFLNDSCTTVRLLDIDVALDVRAARNLIAHRNGPDGRLGTADDDRFDTLAEVDGVSRVGEATLRAILTWASGHGWVMPDLYGGVECVPVSVQQSWDILRVANGATYNELDINAALDARAAQGIVDNRPFGTPEDVALAPYVGASALRKVITWGAQNPVVLLSNDISVPVLEIYTAGLWFTSESDYPLDVWILPDPGVAITELNAKDVITNAYVQRAGDYTLAEREAEETDLAWFFDRYTVEEGWWDDQMRADAVKWENLRRVFDTQLDDVQVFRFGVRSGNWLSGAIDVFIIGHTREGDIVGIRTVSVET